MVEIIACLLIVLFVYAGVIKLLDYKTFAAQIGQSPMLTRWANVLAWLVPSSEIFISLLLAFSRSRMIGLYGSFALMTMFTAYIVMAMNFFDYVPCSCGGIIEGMTWSQHLVFNVCFLLLTIAGVLLEMPRKIVQQPEAT